METCCVQSIGPLRSTKGVETGSLGSRPEYSVDLRLIRIGVCGRTPGRIAAAASFCLEKARHSLQRRGVVKHSRRHCGVEKPASLRRNGSGAAYCLGLRRTFLKTAPRPSRSNRAGLLARRCPFPTFPIAGVRGDHPPGRRGTLILVPINSRRRRSRHGRGGGRRARGWAGWWRIPLFPGR